MGALRSTTIKLKFNSLLVFAFFLALTSHAWAGLMELSATYSTRSSSIDSNNYTESQSWTGSFAWYFLEMSALEFSYTNGLGEQVLMASGDPGQTRYYQVVEMYSVDAVLTLAPRTSFIQPFIRGGAAHLRKRIYRQDYLNDITLYGSPVDAIVPSYGVGLNINITDGFALKGSYDRWESGTSGNTGIWDDALKAGVSWFF